MCEEMDPAEVLEAEEIARHRIINETIARGDSRVQQFYAGAVVLVTGGSGFLGKQLIEKLLRSAKIEKVYMLLRQKKNKMAEQRLNDFFEDPVFECLRKSQPNFTEKIIPVMADLAEINVGIREEDWKIITQEVTVIFHGAASVSFSEPLKVAAHTNVRGAMEMFKLARACKNLKSFVHISSAFAHATYRRREQQVLEKFYESPMSPELLLHLVDTVRDEVLDAITPQLIQDWPNTYTFTKAIAEEAVRTMAADLPICIVRPTVVISAKCEPVPGWIDQSCVFGISGIVVGLAMGIVHLFHSTGDIPADLVPVDIVNNAIIAAAHATAVRRIEGDNDIHIYHVTSSSDHFTMDGMNNNIALAFGEIPTPKALWLGFSWATDYKLIYKLVGWFLHYIPAYLVDGVLKMIGKEPMLSKVYNKIDKLSGALEYFLNNYWWFDDTNLKNLFSSLSPDDQTIYNCDIKPMDWRRYILFWCLGCRKYIIKDGLKNTASGIRKQNIFRFLNTLGLSFYGYMIYLLFNFLCSVRYLKPAKILMKYFS